MSRRGTFNPVNISTLRPCTMPLIGRAFEFDFAGTSGNDEPYPGQTRWVISRKHDGELTSDQRGLWCPAEDIQFEDTTENEGTAGKANV